MSLAQQITAAYGGHWYGRYGRCGCPVHMGDGESLQIKDKPERSDGIDVHCFVGCDWRAVKAELARRGFINGQPGAAPQVDLERARQLAERERAEREAHYQRAMQTWQRSRPGGASPEVQAYLRARAIDLERIGIPECLRFSPSCFHGLTGTHHPAMVAAITDATGKMTAIHQTYLRETGTGKADLEKQKLVLGSCGGGAIRLFPARSELGLSEGIENALSARQLTGIPTWAAISSSGLIGFMAPPKIRRVVIFADFDRINPKTGKRPGTHAAETLAERLRQQRIDCEIRYPAGGHKDWNDQLQAMKARAA